MGGEMMLWSDPGFQLALGLGLGCLGFSLALVYGEDVILWVHIRDKALRRRVKNTLQQNRRQR